MHAFVLVIISVFACMPLVKSKLCSYALDVLFCRPLMNGHSGSIVYVIDADTGCRYRFGMLFGECRRQHTVDDQTYFQAMIISKAIEEFHSSFEYPRQIRGLKPLSKTTHLPELSDSATLEAEDIRTRPPEPFERSRDGFRTREQNKENGFNNSSNTYTSGDSSETVARRFQEYSQISNSDLPERAVKRPSSYDGADSTFDTMQQMGASPSLHSFNHSTPQIQRSSSAPVRTRSAPVRTFNQLTNESTSTESSAASLVLSFPDLNTKVEAPEENLDPLNEREISEVQPLSENSSQSPVTFSLRPDSEDSGFATVEAMSQSAAPNIPIMETSSFSDGLEDSGLESTRNQPPEGSSNSSAKRKP